MYFAGTDSVLGWVGTLGEFTFGALVVVPFGQHGFATALGIQHYGNFSLVCLHSSCENVEEEDILNV